MWGGNGCTVPCIVNQPGLDGNKRTVQCPATVPWTETPVSNREEAGCVQKQGATAAPVGKQTSNVQPTASTVNNCAIRIPKQIKKTSIWS